MSVHVLPLVSVAAIFNTGIQMAHMLHVCRIWVACVLNTRNIRRCNMKAPIVSGMCAARMYSACHHMRVARMWAAHNFQIRAVHKQATYMRHACSTRTTAIKVALILHSSHAYVQNTSCSTLAAARVLNKCQILYVHGVNCTYACCMRAAHIAFL